MQHKYMQYKLTNDDEIVCEVVQLTENQNVIVKNALKVIHAEDPERGLRYYYFRPFMVFQDDRSQVISSMHVIVAAEPSTEMINHYKEAIEDSIAKKQESASGKEDEIQSAWDMLAQDEEDFLNNFSIEKGDKLH